jgi:hypothetical protein
MVVRPVLSIGLPGKMIFAKGFNVTLFIGVERFVSFVVGLASKIVGFIWVKMG